MAHWIQPQMFYPSSLLAALYGWKLRYWLGTPFTQMQEEKVSRYHTAQTKLNFQSDMPQTEVRSLDNTREAKNIATFL